MGNRQSTSAARQLKERGSRPAEALSPTNCSGGRPGRYPAAKGNCYLSVSVTRNGVFAVFSFVTCKIHGLCYYQSAHIEFSAEGSRSECPTSRSNQQPCAPSHLGALLFCVDGSSAGGTLGDAKSVALRLEKEGLDHRRLRLSGNSRSNAGIRGGTARSPGSWDGSIPATGLPPLSFGARASSDLTGRLGPIFCSCGTKPGIVVNSM